MKNTNEKIKNVEDHLNQISDQMEESIPKNLLKLHTHARIFLTHIAKNTDKEEYTPSEIQQICRNKPIEAVQLGQFLSGHAFQLLKPIFFKRSPDYKIIEKNEFNDLLQNHKKNTDVKNIGFFFKIKD